MLLHMSTSLLCAVLYTVYMLSPPNSQRMLDMATKKGCYSKLVRSDIEDYLNSSPPTRHDLIVSGDALQYVGPLERVFKEAYRVLRPGGHFALTVPLLTADPRVVKSAVVSDSDDAVSDGVVGDTDTGSTSSSNNVDSSSSSESSVAVDNRYVQ
jgi:trans-aconitate methyltransferase